VNDPADGAVVTDVAVTEDLSPLTEVLDDSFLLLE
jgi:hypothetical protein